MDLMSNTCEASIYEQSNSLAISRIRAVVGGQPSAIICPVLAFLFLFPFFMFPGWSLIFIFWSNSTGIEGDCCAALLLGHRFDFYRLKMADRIGIEWFNHDLIRRLTGQQSPDFLICIPFGEGHYLVIFF